MPVPWLSCGYQATADGRYGGKIARAESRPRIRSPAPWTSIAVRRLASRRAAAPACGCAVVVTAVVRSARRPDARRARPPRSRPPAKAEKQTPPPRRADHRGARQRRAGHRLRDRAARQVSSPLNANVGEQVKENFKRMVQAESTNQQVRAILEEVIRSQSGQVARADRRHLRGAQDAVRHDRCRSRPWTAPAPARCRSSRRRRRRS